MLGQFTLLLCTKLTTKRMFASQCKLVERQTSPPDYLTESELISLMEKHGIGTDASIPVHINNICERNYVQVTTGRRLKPTTLGVVLVHGYQKVCIWLCWSWKCFLSVQVRLVKLQISITGKSDLNALVLCHNNYHQCFSYFYDLDFKFWHWYIFSNESFAAFIIWPENINELLVILKQLWSELKYILLLFFRFLNIGVLHLACCINEE